MPVSEQAAEWLVAFDDGGLEFAEKQKFLLWLKESPAHIKEFLQLSTMHVELTQDKHFQSSINELVAVAKTDVVELHAATFATSPTPDPVSRSRVRHTRLRWLSIAATIVIGLSITTWFWIGQGGLDSGHVYRTELGEQRSIALDDGSMITLNTLSEVRVTFTEQSRDVTLVAGEALFDVTKDAARPFHVDAGAMQLTVVGTRFNVYRQAEQTVLTVVEGKVAVATTSELAADALGQTVASPLLAVAGDQVAVAASGGGVTRAELPAAEESTAWTQRKLIFQDRRLADVAEEFNRYNHRPLIIDDAALGNRPITGVFNAHDAELLSMFLSNQPGIEVQRTDSGIHVMLSNEQNESN